MSSNLWKGVPDRDVRHDILARSLLEAEHGIRFRKSCPSNSITNIDSGTCSVWFDICRTKLPRPFRIPAGEDVFRQIRAERKWFKNVRLFPSDLPNLPRGARNSSHSGNLIEQQSVLLVPTAKNEIMEQFVIHPTPSESLPHFPRSDVPQDVAAKAISCIAEICGVTLDELRSMCGSGSNLLDSLGFDSLITLAMVSAIRNLGIEIPRPAYGPDLGTFLESFILEYIDMVDRVASRNYFP